MMFNKDWVRYWKSGLSGRNSGTPSQKQKWAVASEADTKAEKQMKFGSPVLSCLFLEHGVAVVHPLVRGDVDASARVLLWCLLQHVVHDALAVLPHVPQRAPHHIGRVVFLPEEVLGLLQEQRDAGVGDHPHGGAPADIHLKPHRGSVVRPQDTRRAVDLWARTLAQHLPRTGDYGAQVTVQLQGLEDREQGVRGEERLFVISFPVG